MTVDDAARRKWREPMLRACDGDCGEIKQLTEIILKGAGGLPRFKRALPLILREAMDEVVDTPRTNRLGLDQTKMNERVYLAVKVRARLRNLLRVPGGKTLDIFAGGIEVAIQSTISETWQIPRAVFGSPCILAKADPVHSVCSVGVIAGLAGVRWILRDEPLPGRSR